MPGILDQVIADLLAETDSLEAVLRQVPFAQWEKPTHAPGWAIRDQVAHLAHFDDTARLAIQDPEAFAAAAKRDRSAPPPPPGSEPAYLLAARERPAPDIFDWWERSRHELVEAAGTLEGDRRMPWFGPPMSGVSFLTARLMEAWSHGLDIVDVAGVMRSESERLRHIAFLGFRTRGYSYQTRGLEPNSEPVRVELTAPDGQLWVFGEANAEQVVRGPAADFCAVVTRRRHVADTRLETEGEAAAEWMLFAQAYAGPPGEGRKPGQFPVAHP